ncbi:NTF2-like protein [Mollisia scopiformis]|uniref:NTF2-like protein n=1 Tax=Mollisia scopiformis TaxID=149040 RepID=A0A194XBR1_MOLSC|nr:NTF2-like protein [Mollisia scopiformis]KUJ17600.1 NTF2-like protein [Mollisia scopiformis]
MTLDIDTSKAPTPLPTPRLTKVSSRVSLLSPLSRQGSGPGLIILTSDSKDNLAIKQGVPSLLRKWAEEGYSVVEIQENALQNGKAEELLERAVSALSECEKCEPKGVVGLVAYEPKLWNQVASKLHSFKEIVAAILYASASEVSSLEPSHLPLIRHVAGKFKATRSPQLTDYENPQVSSYLFATPFQDHFNYSAEAVSHTRNLTFLKKHMNGPFFDLEVIWDEHTYFEFENRSVEHTMATMVDEPYVNHIPTITGGIGRENLTSFYAHHFIFKNPEDTELELISRTIGVDRIVDEFIFKFTHQTEVDWLIPGIPATNKRVEIPFMAVVNIRGDRLYHEHIAWDQGTVLAQLGLLPEYLPYPHPLPDGRQPGAGKKFEYRLPVAGIETAEKMRDKNSVSSNEMFAFGIREV